MVEKLENLNEEYREVVFKDLSSGEEFVICSTVDTRKTKNVDGEEMPLLEVEVTSSSHPFYTGEQKLVDTEGRVERFERKYGNLTGEDEAEEEEE